MGGLIRGFDWWWNYFYTNYYVIGPHVIGHVLLSAGQQEVEVSVAPAKILQVFLHTDPGSEIPVCQGDINYVGCAQRDNDFTIYANISTNTATVYWIVLFDTSNIDTKKKIAPK